MKVLHVITGLEGGGAERQLVNLLRGSTGVPIQHEVVSLLDGGVYGRDVRATGAELHTLNMARNRFSPLALFRLAGLIHRSRPDIVQTWLYHADLIGLLAARLAGRAPVVWTLRSSRLELHHYSKLTGLTITALSRLSRWPAAILSNSTAGMNAHVAIGYRPRCARVIPNGIDTNTFRPSESARKEVRAELGIGADTPLIGCIARCDPMKDHLNVFSAFARVAADARLLLAGRGTEPGNRELSNQICLGGLGPEQVIRLGERRDTDRIIAALDILVLGSAFGEGFPNALGEAMACGVPCVATDVGDNAAIIGGCGGIAPPRDPQALAEAMSCLLALSSDERRALGLRARERIQKDYSISAMVRRYSEEYALLAPQKLYSYESVRSA
jgi:glycosyltransferase involved in cell wall biosynthesis